MTDGRMSITPLMLVTIIFLKVNYYFKDTTSIYRAMENNSDTVHLEQRTTEEELL